MYKVSLGVTTTVSFIEGVVRDDQVFAELQFPVCTVKSVFAKIKLGVSRRSSMYLNFMVFYFERSKVEGMFKS